MTGVLVGFLVLLVVLGAVVARSGVRERRRRLAGHAAADAPRRGGAPGDPSAMAQGVHQSQGLGPGA